MRDQENRKFWKTAIKVVLGGVLIMALFWLGLWMIAKFESASLESEPADWGIVKDSPLR